MEFVYSVGLSLCNGKRSDHDAVTLSGPPGVRSFYPHFIFHVNTSFGILKCQRARHIPSSGFSFTTPARSNIFTYTQQLHTHTHTHRHPCHTCPQYQQLVGVKFMPVLVYDSNTEYPVICAHYVYYDCQIECSICPFYHP